MTTHRIKPGECVSTLAARMWLPVEAIWDDPGNAALREAGRDPNVLAPGDEVALPKPTARVFEVETDGAHGFRVKRPRAVFRLRLRRNGEPLAREPFTLTAGDRVVEGEADEDGHLEVAVPADLTRATLALPRRGERYEFMLGHLEPAEHWRGAAQRLRSLGLYDADAAAPDDRLRRALRLFQGTCGLAVTGALDEPTIAALKEAHGC